MIIKELLKDNVGWKLFEQNENGILYPLFIGKNNQTPIGKWVQAENIPTKSFALRPGWHLGKDIPDAPWLRGYDGSDLGPYNSRFKNGKRVWCLVEYEATNNYCDEVAKLPKKCFENKVPENGYYWFKEGSRGTWIITSAIKIIRVVSEEERKLFLKEKNYDEIKAYAKYKQTFEKRMETIKNKQCKNNA